MKIFDTVSELESAKLKKGQLVGIKGATGSKIIAKTVLSALNFDY